MPTLGELIQYRDDLLDSKEQISFNLKFNETLQSFNSLLIRNENIKTNYPPTLNTFRSIKSLQGQVATLNDELDKYVSNLITDLDTDINNKIDALISQQPFPSEIRGNYNRQPLDISVIYGRLNNLCNWHYPGLMLLPENKECIDYMVSSEPLYLTYDRLAPIDKIISEYPKLFCQRLRLYDNLASLPKNQFGVVVAWNYLNHIRLDFFNEFLSTMFELLRPGGTFVFSYNNCDITSMATIAEQNYIPYAGKSRLSSLCTQLGFEIGLFKDYETGNKPYTHISWAEIKKPGTLTTIKGHPTLGKIIEK